jgi:hypothetical protein
MAASYVSNIVINSGSSFSQSYELVASDTNEELNLNGYTITSQLRKYSGSLNAVSFATTAILPLSSGSIRISLTAEETTNLKPGRYVYDVILTKNQDGTKTRVIEGMVLVSEGVTR